MGHYLFLLVLFLSLTFQSSAQGGNEYTIQKFNTENGLPSNGIKGLQWDE